MFELVKRGKNKVQTDYVLADIYKWYNKKAEEPYKVSKQIFRKICCEFNKTLINRMLTEAQAYRMPARMGIIHISEYAPRTESKKYPINFNESRKLGKTVRHLNDHSNGRQYYWRWAKKGIMIKNKEYYIFDATRTMSRDLAKMVIKHKMVYMTYHN